MAFRPMVGQKPHGGRMQFRETLTLRVYEAKKSTRILANLVFPTLSVHLEPQPAKKLSKNGMV